MTGRCPVLKSACACCRGSMKEEQDHCQIGGVWICLHSSNSWQKSATIFSQGVCSPLLRTSLLQCLCAKKKEDDRAMPSVAICRCRESCITIVGKGRCPVFQCETECCQAKLFWTMMRLLYNLRAFKMILKRHLNEKNHELPIAILYENISPFQKLKGPNHVGMLTGWLVLPRVERSKPADQTHCTKNQAYNSSQKSAAIFAQEAFRFCARCWRVVSLWV